MILTDIKRYLIERRTATLADIAIHFDTEPDAIRGMLEHWMSKGAVRRRALSASCGNRCSQCDPTATEVYDWIESAGIDASTAERHPMVDGVCTNAMRR